MAYTPPQRKTIKVITKIARKRYGPGGYTKAERRKIRSAFLTGRTEANFGNPAGGDGTSVGWRQETASSYPGVDRMNRKQSVKRYFNEVDSSYAGERAPALAQKVQRSAYPSRYAEHGAEGRKLTRKVVRGKAVAGGRAATGPSITSKTKRIPGVDNSALRNAAKIDYLQHRGEPDALLNLTHSLTDAKDVPSSTKTNWKVKPGREAGPGNGGKNPSVGEVATLVRRASRMNRKHMPYVLGGGHGNPKATGPWDCSGAISRLFRINPRVSGQFMAWGKPGKGKHVTVYANSGHVFAEINGKFFGTSRSNPGGGAGWIPASQMSPSYLAQFTKRHPAGM
jgi:hypothetical protein